MIHVNLATSSSDSSQILALVLEYFDFEGSCDVFVLAF